jgi:hypothetical protein
VLDELGERPLLAGLGDQRRVPAEGSGVAVEGVVEIEVVHRHVP